MSNIYLVGSMRNPAVPEVAAALREDGHHVFDDWYSPGPEADEYWQAYETRRGHTYKEALYGPHATNVFNFDHHYLQEADTVILVMPAGRSGHLELGWAVGQGKRTFVLFDNEPERYDVMYRFVNEVCMSVEELKEALRG